MKKKGIALIALLTLSVAMGAAGCGDDDIPDTPVVPGSEGDRYQDYTSNKNPGGNSFEYDGNYSNPELAIDGKADDPQWQAAESLLTYGKDNAVTVKAYRGDKALFFLFEVRDNVLLTQGVTNDDAVTRGDSIEFYIDTKGDGGRNPQSDDFQINLGIHGKTRIMQGSGSNWGTWNGLVDYEVSLDGTLNDGAETNDTGYTVEVMIQYKDIQIEKNDTIGLAFGQVDKVRTEDAARGSVDGPWNWYGWAFNGTAVDPQKPNTYVMYDKDGNLISRDAIAMPPADMAGSVTNKSGAPVEGATATVTVGGEEKTATTDERGYFVFEQIDSDSDYTVSVTKEGYTVAQQTYTRAELREANGKIVVKNFVIMSEADLVYTTLTGTVKNLINGAVGGATITLKGTPNSVTAGADGTFTFERIPANAGELTLVVSKEGYRDSETTVAQSSLVGDGTTALGDVNLNLPAAETGGFGRGDGLANNYGYFTRALTGFEFFFEGEKSLNGAIELFIDTKESTDSRNPTDVLYLLNGTGTVTVNNDLGGGSFTTSGIEWTVNPIEGAGYTARLFIPYETLGVSAFEPIGISLGQNNGQGRWDGWGRDDFIGTNGIAFVAPEIPTDYVRFGTTNNFYEATNNNASARVGGVVKAGETPLAGVTVTVGGLTAITGADGAWSANLPVDGTSYTVTYTLQGYTVKTSNISGDELEARYSWSETAVLDEQKVSITGIVTDSATGEPVEGVVVAIGSNTMTTGADGRYTLSNIGTFEGVTVTYTKDGYAAGSQVFTAAQLAASNSHTADKALISESNIQYVTATGLIVGLDGPVAGATVAVVGNDELTATTDASGAFSIADFAGKDCTLKVEKDGYIAGTLSFSASALGAGDETYAFDTLFLQRDYVTFGSLEEKAEAAFAGFTGYFTRSETAFEIKFVGAREWKSSANLEVYFNVTAGVKKEKAIILQNNTTSGDGYTVRIEDADTTPVVYLTVPYAWLGVTKTDIVGIAVGQWSTAVTDWDPLQGVDADAASNYLRLDVDNAVFHYDTNNRPVTVSGNVGIAGITVSIGSINATSGENGDWSLVLPSTSAELTINYGKTGYISQTQTIAAGAIALTRTYQAENVALQAQTVGISGTVVDQDGAPISGAQIALVIGGETVKTAETDATGRYTLTDVATFTGVTLVFSAGDGYTTGETALTQTELATAENGTLTADKTLTETSQVKKITVTGKIIDIEGALQGATITLGEETIGTAGADGTFTLNEFELKDCKLTVSCDGYLPAEIAFSADAVGDATAFDLHDIYLTKEYEQLGSAFGKKSESFASFVPYVTRGESEFKFKFVGSAAFNGHIEMFVDTKNSKGEGARDETDYRFNLGSDGNIAIVSWAGGNETPQTVAPNLVLNVTEEDGNPVVYFTLPYDQLNVERTEIVGISFGQWSIAASAWDGWTLTGDYAAQKGANGEAFVRPEMTWDYIRIGVDNKPFVNAANIALDVLDLNGYNLHFGKFNDSIHAKVSRDSEGITFEFATIGDFGRSINPNSGQDSEEVILIYIDTGAPVGGWGNDYQVKITSGGKVAIKNGAWWNVNDGNDRGTVNTAADENGVRKFSYKVLYTDIGLAGGTEETVGFALVEGWLTVDNWSDEYGGMIYTKQNGFYVMGDAANEATFVRVDKDGNLFVAESNNA